MCGIVGYIGENEATSIILKGLRELEYRGYDSAGMTLLQDSGLERFRAVGKLDNLLEKLKERRSEGLVSAIGHTRWATHGKPNEANAHPHALTHSQVVHNGIIENYLELRSGLSTPFLSQTDSEVIVHIFERHLPSRPEDLSQVLKAFRATLDELQGAYAILLMTEFAPGCIFFARQGSPLQVGITPEGTFFASSDAAMVGVCTDAVYLEDGQWGVAEVSGLRLFDAAGASEEPKFKPLPASSQSARKEGYRYFMEKEIYEQSQVLADILRGRLSKDGITLETFDPQWLQQFSRVTLCACGTSYHAALVGSYLIERLAKVPARVEIASEFRYRQPVLEKDTLFIAISQSGETADTLEALKLARKNGLETLVLCNVDNSSMVREASQSVLLRAGIEKGVASTKAFSAQVFTLWILSVYWGSGKGTLSAAEIETEVEAMKQAVQVTQIDNSVHEKIHRLSKRYLHGHGFFFIGRDLFYPLALEGALKLKEISYLHAEGYPAGEMKHGPIALADAELFTIALMPKNVLFEKVKSNVEELSARDSTIVAIAPEAYPLADDLLLIDEYTHPMLEFFAMLIMVQLLSMEISIRLGNDVDMPRNLAKSVTVE